MSIQNHNVVDLITHDPRLDEFALIMVEDRPWGDDPDRLEDLREKFKTYFAYVVDGGLVRSYPAAADRPVRIQLDCFTPPPPKVRSFLKQLAGISNEYGIRVIIQLIGHDGRSGRIDSL